MGHSKEDLAEAEALVQPVVDALATELAAVIVKVMARNYLDGLEAGGSKKLAALNAFLSGNALAQPAQVPGKEVVPEVGVATESLPGETDRASAQSLPRASAGASARSVAYEAVRRAHPMPVPSRALLRILRDWDGAPPSTKRDDLFYKSMKRLRETGQLSFDEVAGYTLPPGVEP